MPRTYNLKLSQEELEFLHSSLSKAKNFELLKDHLNGTTLKLISSLQIKTTKLTNISNDDAN